MRTNNTPEGLVRISGKALGELALASSCDRCTWLKLRLHNRLPFQIFPSIFSSIDAFSKNLVHAYLDMHGAPPPWLSPLGDVVGYRDPPHWSRFQRVDEGHGILMTGAPDGVLVLRDGRILIIDYKTARYSDGQDALLPMYQVQLITYAMIAEHVGLGEVAAASLVYTEPRTSGKPADDLVGDAGFALPFSVKLVAVELKRELIPPLLARVRRIHDSTVPPAGREGCRDCARVAAMVRTIA